MSSKSDQAILVGNLLRAFQLRYGKQHVDLLETHISYVLLTGQHAYKIKKAVKLDFLDFGSLERRLHYCREELRLNQRYAPHLYLGVVSIGGSTDAPQMESAGPAIEYAVKMREFPQKFLAENLLRSGELNERHIDQIAATLAAFHNICQKAATNSRHGSSAQILQTVRDNFLEIRPFLSADEDLADLKQVEQWTETEFAIHANAFDERKADGFVRECHGDLHLGNLALIDDEMSFFDCIEFNEDLRWIDVMSEVAFLVMDLDARQAPEYAYRLLNAYLQDAGDYAGLAVLRFYVVYRAVVRAKIALLRMPQRNGVEDVELMGKYRAYMRLARRWIEFSPAGIVMMHGLSGSGKSYLSQRLLQMSGAIRLRSDVERKRLVDLPAKADSKSAICGDLYADTATRATYRRLFFLAQSVLKAGFTVIVDAAFLQRWQRRMFSDWAVSQKVPVAILDVTAPQTVLRERVAQRALQSTDVSEADLRVLDHQLTAEEPIGVDETALVLTYQSNRPFEDGTNVATLRKLFSHLKKKI